MSDYDIHINTKYICIIYIKRHATNRDYIIPGCLVGPRVTGYNLYISEHTIRGKLFTTIPPGEISLCSEHNYSINTRFKCTIYKFLKF